MPLAETYLSTTINGASQWLLIVIKRIFNILTTLTLSDDGNINELTNLVTRSGEQYQGIEDFFQYDPRNPKKTIPYSILKKLKAGNDSYEIRFADGIGQYHREYRIVLTVHKKLNCLVLTHGFSKIRKINYYYGIGDANSVTTQLSKAASDLYKIINDEINGESGTNLYLGKEGDRYEVEL